MLNYLGVVALTASRDAGAEKDDGTMIEELDVVVLTRDLPDQKLKAGDVGTVVLVHGEGAAYGIELMTLAGDAIAVLTVDTADLRPARDREVMHAREAV